MFIFHHKDINKRYGIAPSNCGVWTSSIVFIVAHCILPVYRILSRCNVLQPHFASGYCIIHRHKVLYKCFIVQHSRKTYSMYPRKCMLTKTYSTLHHYCTYRITQYKQLPRKKVASIFHLLFHTLVLINRRLKKATTKKSNEEEERMENFLQQHAHVHTQQLYMVYGENEPCVHCQVLYCSTAEHDGGSQTRHIFVWQDVQIFPSLCTISLWFIARLFRWQWANDREKWQR
jgi:hypothetical protein